MLCRYKLNKPRTAYYALRALAADIRQPYPQRDSNPRRRLERAVSLAARRWGLDGHSRLARGARRRGPIKHRGRAALAAKQMPPSAQLGAAWHRPEPRRQVTRAG